MAKQVINLGTPNGGDGDSLRDAGEKINENFTELYDALANGLGNLADVPEITLPASVPFLVLVAEGGGFALKKVTLTRTEDPDQPETFYLTDDAGNILTDDAGNRLTWN